ncbi:DUF4129 domain-containing protein [Methanofollis fontis]|uniref:Protein-glutamine gamma-glutamyltransferase-like C-terminal domain-containing protein n=1 Tax=Methanofollis fontis TaxID=2052832 RepID=A0A483CTC5_9EURY|nr:DUF4129 domain-containing protein [Methanofollis fontis]TAJ43934.1 hypothetical protein CUJ86_07710 [Methanofollis fontis]
MKRVYIKALLIVVSIGIIVMLFAILDSPLLYSVQNTSSTLSHVNPAKYDVISGDPAGSVIPAMGDLMDRSGTIVVHIRNKDYVAAQEELEQYAAASRSFNNMIINLDMTESEMKEFGDRNRESVDALAVLLEDSRRFDELSSLEIQYRDENNPEYLYSVTYEGDALKLKMEEAYAKYSTQQSRLVNISGRYGVESSSYEQSTDTFSRVVEGVAAAQEERTAQITLNPLFPMTLGIDTDTARFGESIIMAGTLYRSPYTDVSIYIDSTLRGTVQTDIDGRYIAEYPAGDLKAGRHLVYATHGSRYSRVIEFTVLPSAADLTLSVRMITEDEANVACSGTLTCHDMPVSGERVTIVSDDGRSVETITDESGSYYCTGQFEPGIRSVYASVDGETHPLEYTTSEIVTLEIPPPAATITSLILKIAAVLIACLVGAAILRDEMMRKTWRNASPVPRRTASPGLFHPETPEWPRPLPAPEEIAQRYADLVGGNRYGDAVRLLYCSIAARIARKAQISNYPAWTPREILGAGAKGPDDGLKHFIGLYEEARYGSDSPTADTARLVFSSYDTVVKDFGGVND